MSDGALSNARNLVIKFATATIAASTVCTIPDSIEKFYIFDATGLTNPTNLTIKTASGTGFTLDQAKIYAAELDLKDILEKTISLAEKEIKNKGNFMYGDLMKIAAAERRKHIKTIMARVLYPYLVIIRCLNIKFIYSNL